jgi:predicted RNase H-like nuclease (RuvC/YqgF family)
LRAEATPKIFVILSEAQDLFSPAARESRSFASLRMTNLKREAFMRRVLAICVLLALGGAAFGQSLGDVARQTRQKEKAKGAAKKKVITNEDIPESPDLTPGQQETVGKPELVSSSPSPSGAQAAEQWKSQILAQKNAIANMQAQIDKLNASIRFVEANAYVNGVQYNQYQVKKQQQVANLQTQLAEQKKKLEEMQVAAKKAGMGSAVYDP